jgi:hypothetical protein
VVVDQAEVAFEQGKVFRKNLTSECLVLRYMNS